MKFQIAEFNTNGIDSSKPLKLDNQQLSTFLRGIDSLSFNTHKHIYVEKVAVYACCSSILTVYFH